MKKILFIVTLWAFVFASCNKETTEFKNGIEKAFNLTSFSRIRGGETFKINIIHGNNFGVTAKGRAEDLADLAINLDANNILQLKYARFKNNRYRVEFTITIPRLAFLVLDGAATATITGFEDQETKIRTVLSGTSSCTINGSAQEMQIELDGASELSLGGNSDIMYGSINSQSKLNAYDLHAKIVEISTQGQSKSYVRPVNKLLVDASDQSEVYFKGDPLTKEIDIKGQAKVVQQ